MKYELMVIPQPIKKYYNFVEAGFVTYRDGTKGSWSKEVYIFSSNYTDIVMKEDLHDYLCDELWSDMDYETMYCADDVPDVAVEMEEEIIANKNCDWCELRDVRTHEVVGYANT